MPLRGYFKPPLSGVVLTVKNPPGEEPGRVESSADDGRKGSSVISGDTCVGNDTSHDGQGDFSERIEPCPSCIRQAVYLKLLGILRFQCPYQVGQHFHSRSGNAKSGTLGGDSFIENGNFRQTFILHIKRHGGYVVIYGV